jgi:hypothetical protein
VATNIIADAFEQHLRSLSNDEWIALVDRVRPHDDTSDVRDNQTPLGDSK